MHKHVQHIWRSHRTLKTWWGVIWLWSQLHLMGGMSWKFELLSHTTEAACSNGRKKREYEMSEIEKESNLSCKGMRLKKKLLPPPWLYPRGTIQYVAKTLNCLLYCPLKSLWEKRPHTDVRVLRKLVIHCVLLWFQMQTAHNQISWGDNYERRANGYEFGTINSLSQNDRNHKTP